MADALFSRGSSEIAGARWEELKEKNEKRNSKRMVVRWNKREKGEMIETKRKRDEAAWRT